MRKMVGVALIKGLANTPSERDLPTRHPGSDEEGAAEQAGDPAHPSAFVCDASSGIWSGHPDGAGPARARGCGHDADIHTRDEKARTGCQKPVRFFMSQL